MDLTPGALFRKLKIGAQIGRNIEEFKIVSARKKIRESVSLYELKSLVPKYEKHEL